MNRPLLAMLAVAVLLAGCSKSDTAANTNAAAGTKAKAAPGADAVAAALQTAGTPIARVAFALAAAPVVGQPVDMRLDISSPTPVLAVLLVAEGDGVAIEPATARVSLSLQTAGATVSHGLKLTPQRNGIVEVKLRLTDGGAESLETTYVIPVLVPAAATEQAAPPG